MRPYSSSLLAAALWLTLAGCTTTLQGHQSSSGGTTAATASSAVSGSAQVGGGKVSFSSGASPAPNAPGAQLGLGRGATVVLFLGLVVADAVDFLASQLRGSPRPAQGAPLPASISHTCSCYGYKPVMRDE